MVFGGGDAVGRPGGEAEPARATRRQFGAWALGMGLAAPTIASAQLLPNPTVDPRVLQSVATDPRLIRFYALRGWTPAWTDDQARQFSQASQGVAVGPRLQFKALARMRAEVVLPTPRVPVKR